MLGRAQRVALVRRGPGEPSLRRQWRLLGLSRSAWYYRPRSASAATLGLMRRIDEPYLKYPFYGSRQMSRHLRREAINRGG